uniref:Uncharacterized protein n=1 Tax=Neogobius melanostomus TaxID=47308 RepID=A0A8C6SCD1_9GOBI
NRVTLNISRTTTETPRRSSTQSWRLEEGVSTLCAYRMVERGIGGQLCFRHTLPEYKLANILINGSVLLQWTEGEESTRIVGFELSCWWNGSYTQFECTGVQLARSCRDYLLTELHENIPYRICLLTLSRSPHSPKEHDSICVMLVIICLLVAYITENIMSPASTHTYPYRTHSCH